jgi:hypothetical protein
LITTLLGLLWGLAQGMRHALEPDHLAAVSTLVADRKSARSAASYAVAWGLGHALVLMAVGGALLLVRAQLSERVGAMFELAVAAMLIVLGVRALRRAFVDGAAGAPVAHAHATHAHAHGGPAAHVHLRGFTLAMRPLLVGCVHGLAGSGAVAALVMAQLQSAVAGLVYIVVFGAGATLGMAVLAGLAGVPLAKLVRTRRGVPVLLGTTGTLSLLLGIAWGWAAASAAFT